MKDEKIVFATYGDSNYFPFVDLNIKFIKKLYPKSKVIVGDAGLNPNQKRRLGRMEKVQIISWESREELKKNLYSKMGAFFDYIFKLKKYKLAKKVLNLFFPKKGLERAVWKHLVSSKPLFLLKVVSFMEDEILVFLDGDAIITSRIDEVLKREFDIGVTVKTEENCKKSKDKYAKINGGVIFLKCIDRKKILFLSNWAEKTLIEFAKDVGLVEQDALNKIIYNVYTQKKENFKIVEFDQEIYNYANVKKGIYEKNKIIHLKGKNRQEKKKVCFNQLENKLKRI